MSMTALTESGQSKKSKPHLFIHHPLQEQRQPDLWHPIDPVTSLATGPGSVLLQRGLALGVDDLALGVAKGRTKLHASQNATDKL